jgi:hypothetical protein
MQELQQEKSKHYYKRSAGLAEKMHGEQKSSMTTRKMSIQEKMYGERKASMATREKHEAEKRQGMHGCQDFITKQDAGKQNSQI